MPRNWNFQLPTKIEFGRGNLRRLGTMAKTLGQSALLVGYDDPAGMEETYARATESLSKSRIKVHEFFRVTPDPDTTIAEQGAAVARETHAEMIVGLGGGSVVDVAKGIAVLAKTRGNLWDYTLANPDSRPVDEALPIVAVPTTAGTGAEVTAFAVFTHADRGLPLKASIFGAAIYPRLAVVDPDLALGCSSRLTAACGADALGHAIEACLSRGGNPMAAVLAVRAAELIFEHLVAAVENPADAKLREPLALAATLAGVAFDSAGVTAAHSIAQSLGALLHIPHGEAVAIALPPCLEFNAEKAGADGSASVHSAKRVAELFDKIGLPQRVEAKVESPRELAEQLADSAIGSEPIPIKLNPRKITRDQLVELIEKML
jgi:alcohol dehydrogenase class IV